MAVIHIDGKTVNVDKADNLLAACLSLGIDVPYFCYHPALGSVGSCRQCAVKQYNTEEDYKAGRGRLVMSCMVAPTDNMYISVDDEEAKTFRRHIVEYLMTNHPHDCPTCEEGGHCHLQDMTYMSGHNKRRYRFTKRTHRNQDLGAFINHEMNRCIACYRCVRFYKDYADGEDFGVYASNNRVYFGRDADGQFDSEFSGNLTEVCPTGVFTDKTHSDRYNRKWDMQYAPSVCVGCSSGCNISAGERYGELRRIENRYNPDVNGYFLCDKGRFGYGYVNRADRPVHPLQNIGGELVAVSADFALDGVLDLIKDKKVIGIGSSRASLESNFALKKLVGSGNYSTGNRLNTQSLVAKAVDLLRHKDVVNVSMAQVESADCVFILGEDLTQTASRVALSVRQAAKNKGLEMTRALKTDTWLAEPVKRIGQNAKSPVYIACVNDTKLDNIAKVSAVATPADIAELGYLVGEIIEQYADKLSDITDCENTIFAKEQQTDLVNHADGDKLALEFLAHHIAYDLIMADRPLVISGTSLQNADVIEASAFVATKLTQKREQIRAVERAYIEVENAKILAQANTPKFDADKKNRPENDGTPADVKLEAQVVRSPDDKGADDKADVKLLSENTQYADKTGVYMVMPSANSVGVHLLGGAAVEEILANAFDVAIILENDLLNLSNEQRDKLLSKQVIVLDHEYYDWHERCQYVLSSASFAEGDGTLVSAEGRAQRYFAVYDKKYYQPITDIKDSWRWLGAVYGEMNAGVVWENLDDVIQAMTKDNPNLEAIKYAAPESDYRITGLKIAREPRRYSGRTSMRAKLSIHEPMQPKDKDTALTFSMEGYVGEQTPVNALPFVWAAGWNSPQALNKYQDKVGGRLKGGDVGVRLFDRLPRTQTLYYSKKSTLQKPPPSSIFTGRATLVPLYKMFDSSELAFRSEVVVGQMGEQAWYIAKDDATKWLLKDGDVLTITQNDVAVALPVVLVDYLAEGCIGYVVGQVPLVPYLPATVKKSDDVLFVPYYQAQKVKQGLMPQSLSLFNKTKGRNSLGLVQSSLAQPFDNRFDSHSLNKNHHTSADRESTR